MQHTENMLPASGLNNFRYFHNKSQTALHTADNHACRYSLKLTVPSKDNRSPWRMLKILHKFQTPFYCQKTASKWWSNGQI